MVLGIIILDSESPYGCLPWLCVLQSLVTVTVNIFSAKKKKKRGDSKISTPIMQFGLKKKEKLKGVVYHITSSNLQLHL
jgi:hypothetical protein